MMLMFHGEKIKMKLRMSLDERVALGVGGVVGVAVPFVVGYWIGDKIADNIDLVNYVENSIRAASTGVTVAATYQVSSLGGALFGVLSWRALKNISNSVKNYFYDSFN